MYCNNALVLSLCTLKLCNDILDSYQQIIQINLYVGISEAIYIYTQFTAVLIKILLHKHASITDVIKPATVHKSGTI